MSPINIGGNTIFDDHWAHFCLRKIGLGSQLFIGVCKIAHVSFWASLTLFDHRANFCFLEIKGLLVVHWRVVLPHDRVLWWASWFALVLLLSLV